MSDFFTFEASIEPMEWGSATYTVLRLPSEMLAALDTPKRVEGEIADVPVNLAVTRAPVLEDAFVYTGKTFLRSAGIAPGDLVEVRLRAADPDHVEEPAALTRALRGAELTDRWRALTPGKRRSMIAPLNAARTAPTLAKRIDKLLAELTGMG